MKDERRVRKRRRWNGLVSSFIILTSYFLAVTGASAAMRLTGFTTNTAPVAITNLDLVTGSRLATNALNGTNIVGALTNNTSGSAARATTATNAPDGYALASTNWVGAGYLRQPGGVTNWTDAVGRAITSNTVEQASLVLETNLLLQWNEPATDTAALTVAGPGGYSSSVNSEGLLVASPGGTVSLGASGGAAFSGSLTVSNLTLAGILTLTNGAPAPAPGAGWGVLWNSNSCLYWVTGTKTNLINDGQ